MKTQQKKMEIYLSKIDEGRFGIISAKARLVTLDTLPEIFAFCKENKVRFLIARCSSSDLATVQEMENKGFLLMDTLLYYKRDLLKIPIPQDNNNVFIRSFIENDREGIKSVASEAFKGYFGHYHADNKLDRTKCNEVYVSWAENSCIFKEMADEILVAEDDKKKIIGFATLKQNNMKEGEGILYGVLPSFQKRGVFNSLAISSMNYFSKNSKIHMLYSTQLTNIAVQKVWVRLGAELSHSYYTFHKWFDSEREYEI